MELRFTRGATAGGAVLATLILSRRLCPGTPSKVAFCFSSNSSGERGTFSFVLLVLGNLAGFGLSPSANFCARRIALLFGRGAIAGGAVLATVILSRRLCPGTPSNVRSRSSWLILGRLGDVTGLPARREAARVVRGTIEGEVVLAGTGRALKAGLEGGGSDAPREFGAEVDFVSVLVVRWLLSELA